MVPALRGQRSATIHRLGLLDDGEWDRTSPVTVGTDGLLPTVREIAAHLILTDEAILSARTLIARIRSGGDHRWDAAEIERRAAQTPGQLLASLATSRDRMARLASSSIRMAGGRPLRGTTGRQPLEQWWCRRVLHEWLHEQDIADATGGQGDLPVAHVASVLTDAVLRDLPFTALPRADLPTGIVRLMVDTSPRLAPDDGIPVAMPGRRTWSVDFARKHFGPRVVGIPDATVWLQAAGLAFLAGSRRQVDELAPFLLRVEGDRDLARGLLDVVSGSGLMAGEGVMAVG